MNILVTGAKGMLGTDLVPVLEGEGHKVTATDLDELDITKRDFVAKMVGEICPDIVVNCAAYTDVDRAEKEPEKAFSLNAEGVENLTLACKKWDVGLFHISTDYVFDGTKKGPYRTDDLPNPINVYGRSKLAGEKSVRKIMKKYYIVRTSWLYGKHGKNFVHTVLDLTKTQDEIKVVDDQMGSPTWSVSLAHVRTKLIETGKYGIYHVTDETEGGISWFHFAEEIVKIANLNCRIIPAKSSEFPRPAQRPKNSYLDLSSTKKVLDQEMPMWIDSLEFFLQSCRP